MGSLPWDEQSFLEELSRRNPALLFYKVFRNKVISSVLIFIKLEVMKAITNSPLPAFLKIANGIAKEGWNKHLPKPFEAGELVKVHESQTPSKMKFESPSLAHLNSTTPEEKFRKQYVRIYRKNAKGKFENVFVISWEHVEPLLMKKITK
jgi:hypothetical protein